MISDRQIYAMNITTRTSKKLSNILCSYNHLANVLQAKVWLAGAWHTYWCHNNQMEECTTMKEIIKFHCKLHKLYLSKTEIFFIGSIQTRQTFYALVSWERYLVPPKL
jgi:hypothetical protein